MAYLGDSLLLFNRGVLISEENTKNVGGAYCSDGIEVEGGLGGVLEELLHQVDEREGVVSVPLLSVEGSIESDERLQDLGVVVAAVSREGLGASDESSHVEDLVTVLAGQEDVAEPQITVDDVDNVLSKGRAGNVGAQAVVDLLEELIGAREGIVLLVGVAGLKLVNMAVGVVLEGDAGRESAIGVLAGGLGLGLVELVGEDEKLAEEREGVGAVVEDEGQGNAADLLELEGDAAFRRDGGAVEGGEPGAGSLGEAVEILVVIKFSLSRLAIRIERLVDKIVVSADLVELIVGDLVLNIVVDERVLAEQFEEAVIVRIEGAVVNVHVSNGLTENEFMVGDLELIERIEGDTANVGHNGSHIVVVRKHAARSGNDDRVAVLVKLLNELDHLVDGLHGRVVTGDGGVGHKRVVQIENVTKRQNRGSLDSELIGRAHADSMVENDALNAVRVRNRRGDGRKRDASTRSSG